MAKHNSKFFDSLIDFAKRNGCRIDDKGVTVKVFPPNPAIQMLVLHRGEKAAHPLRRYLKNQCHFAID